MNTLVCNANSFTVYCTLLFFSYFSNAAQRLTSALKKKVDNEWELIMEMDSVSC